MVLIINERMEECCKEGSKTMRIAAIGDLHCKTTSAGQMRALLEGIEQEADLLVLAGDLTNVGLPEEMGVLLKDIEDLALPMIAVVGNHDHENDQLDVLIEMMNERGIHVLDGSTVEINGVGFVGTKGFCGGFGKYAVQPFGEQTLKTFIKTSINEARLLENAISRINCSRRVAVLHFAPIKETLEGEAQELFPFLGSSLLADALDRHRVDVIVHGHAHNGFPEGHTAGNIPVYNVSRFVLNKHLKRSYRIIEV